MQELDCALKSNEKAARRYPFSCSPVFDMVMRDEGICKGLIECVLGFDIERIDYHAVEHSLEPGLNARGVRLDAFVKGSGRVYDVEMQASREPCLGERLRYCQSVMDSTLLAKGSGYDELPESWVVFLCDYDPYGRALAAYGFERICREDPLVEAGCRAHWLVLNAHGWESEPDEGLRNLLRYVRSGEVADSLTAEIDAAVSVVNDDPARREAIMGFITMEHNMRVHERVARQEGRAEGREEGLEEGRQEGRAEGLEEGRAEGEARFGALADRLLDDGRIEDLRAASADPELLARLYAEYGL